MTKQLAGGLSTRCDTAIMALLMVVAFMPMGMAPILGGDLVSAGRVDLRQLSHIAAADFLSVGVTSLLLPSLLSLNHVRRTALIGILLNVMGNLWSTQLSGDGLVAARILAGVGGGMLIWLQYEYVARNARPERLSGLYLAAYIGGAVALSALASNVLVPGYGVNGIYLSMVALALVAGVVLLFGPKRMDTAPRPAAGSARRAGGALPMPAVAALLSVFFMNAFSATLWTYFEPISATANIPKSVSDLSAIGSLILQLGGTILAALVAHRVRYAPVLLACGLISIIQCVYLFWGNLTVVGFLIFSLVFGAVGYFMVPFQIALAINSDDSRRAVALFSVPLVLGSGFGPVISSLVVSDADPHSGVMVALVCSGASLLMLIAAMSMGRTQRLAT